MVDAVMTFFGRALEAAGVGGWEYDIATGRLSWTPVTYQIHEMEIGEPPTLDQALSFYTMESRPVIALAVQRGIEHGESWDLELPFVTARGRHIWVRACGQPVQENGVTVMLSGAFQDITARRDLLSRVERLSAVAREMTNAVIITDPAGRTEWVNAAFERMSGYTLAELSGLSARELMRGPDSDAGLALAMSEKAARGEGYEVEIVAYGRGGNPFWIAVTATPIRDASGTVTAFMAVASDVTARRRAEEDAAMQAQERQRAEALLRDVLETLPNAVAAYDPDERLALTNQAYTDMFPIEALLAQSGRKLHDLIQAAIIDGQYPDVGTTDRDREVWLEEFARRDRVSGIARSLRLPDGRFVQEQERRSASGNLVRVHTDTTDLKRAEEALRDQAYRDALTNLPNRRAFLAALEGERERMPHDEDQRGRTPRDDQRFGSLALVDLDFFKDINDSLGHDVGDEVLIQVGLRLAASMQDGDVASRLGGDEFAILLASPINVISVEARMDRIVAALIEPMHIRGRELHVTVSAGVTLITSGNETFAALLKNADLALYEAKKSGRARWCWFRPEQAEGLARRINLSTALRGALLDGAIDVALQPKRLLRGGHLGFEALARWHDGSAWKATSDFVGEAEDTGLLIQLGSRVADIAMSRVSLLRGLGYDIGRVALNVTGRQLLERSFLNDILDTLHRHGLDPSDLEFEVAEAVLLGHTSVRVEQALRDARRLGIGLVLDDYGTGHASLAHLSRLPFDRLKIDRSFVAEIGLGPRGGVIARSVIALARSLDMQSVADGVETQEQMAFLQSEGCDAVQGPFIARPMMTANEAALYLGVEGMIPRGPELKLVKSD
jgi:diguanylate cyclase (GGDEF)-like protein/PAS domain S-box-containing protein